MADHGKLSITFTGTDQPPWVVFHPDSVDEGGYMVQEARAKGLFLKVREVQAEYAGVSTEQALQTVRQTFPNAQVVQDNDPWAGTGLPPASANAPQAAYNQAVAAYNQQPPAQQLPQGQGVPCSTCGGPTQFKSGTSKQGKQYKGHFCIQNRDHAPVWG